MPVIIADTACVDPRAKLADGVQIGPYCVVGPNVSIGANTRLIGHVYVHGVTRIGEDNTLFPFCMVGEEPSAHELAGGFRHVEIGARNVIREGVIIEGGPGEAGRTRIGEDNRLHAYAQVGGGSSVFQRVQLNNGAILGARVHVDSDAVISAATVVHHDTTIGAFSFAGVQSRIHRDVPPFLIVDGNPARPRCINVVALKRLGKKAQAIESLHEAHRLLYRGKLKPAQAATTLASRALMTPEVAQLLAFVEAQESGRHGRARDSVRGVIGQGTSFEKVIQADPK